MGACVRACEHTHGARQANALVHDVKNAKVEVTRKQEMRNGPRMNDRKNASSTS